MPQVGNPKAPFFNLQDAYDNGARVFDIGEDAGGWTPGGLIAKSIGETIVFRSSGNVANVGDITGGVHTFIRDDDFHIANRTDDTNYGNTTWLYAISPTLTIISESPAITFGNIHLEGRGWRVRS